MYKRVFCFRQLAYYNKRKCLYVLYYNLVCTSYVIVNVVPIMYVMLIEKPRVPKSILHYEYTHAWEIHRYKSWKR